MAERQYAYTAPSMPLLRWLADPGPNVPPQVAKVLMGELFASPNAIIAGMVNGLFLNVTALLMNDGPVFGVFIALDLALVTARLLVVRKVLVAASCGAPTATGLYLISGCLWCALQGAMAFTAMQTNSVALKLLAATMVMGLIGPICARNYAAPRYALTLVALCDLPFVTGAALSGDPWLLILVLQTPALFFGVKAVIRRFRNMSVATLKAEQESYDRARRDALTGLLNRFGLMEMLDRYFESAPLRFIVFYLDLDGFKPINDNFGHHAGDRIIRAVAERLTTVVRPDDILSRLGGDEFVIVAPEMDPTEGEAYADRIIREVAGENYPLAGAGSVRIGISVGFACAPEDGLAGDELHRKADQALYEAKAAGRGVMRRYSGIRRSTPAVTLVEDIIVAEPVVTR